jgi:ABC-type antimicrobial peptide transport system permease subunit
MSLGATAGDIRTLVVRQGDTQAALGVAAGLVLAVPTTRLFASQLLGVGALDPISYAGTGLAVAALAAAACYVPARRASRLDPVLALRKE